MRHGYALRSKHALLTCLFGGDTSSHLWTQRRLVTMRALLQQHALAKVPRHVQLTLRSVTSPWYASKTPSLPTQVGRGHDDDQHPPSILRRPSPSFSRLPRPIASVPRNRVWKGPRVRRQSVANDRTLRDLSLSPRHSSRWMSSAGASTKSDLRFTQTASEVYGGRDRESG